MFFGGGGESTKFNSRVLILVPNLQSFGTDQSSEVEFSEEQCSEMESNGVPKDDKPSNNKMEQSEASPTKT